MLLMSCKECKTNDFVFEKVQSLVGPQERLLGPQERLLSTIKKRKLKLYGHTSRHVTLAKTIMEGTVKGGQWRGRQHKSWADNIKE